MARTVKEQEYAEKRNDILDSALRLVYSKGYERMTIQDIQADLQISSGAFYHYFEFETGPAGSPGRAHGQPGNTSLYPHPAGPSSVGHSKISPLF